MKKKDFLSYEIDYIVAYIQRRKLKDGLDMTSARFNRVDAEMQSYIDRKSTGVKFLNLLEKYISSGDRQKIRAAIRSAKYRHHHYEDSQVKIRNFMNGKLESIQCRLKHHVTKSKIVECAIYLLENNLEQCETNEEFEEFFIIDSIRHIEDIAYHWKDDE